MRTTIREVLDGNDDWVTCRCGNEPHIDGFYACADDGRLVEPVIGGEWGGRLYVCMRCGRYFDTNTMEVVGVTSEHVAYLNANYDWENY